MKLKYLSAILLGMIVSALWTSAIWVAAIWGIPDKHANTLQTICGMGILLGSIFFIIIIIGIFVNIFNKEE